MISYQVNQWKSASWRRDTRYYHCELKQDLFGEWLILRSWGDVRSQRGRQMENRCNDLTEAEEVFKEVVKRRQYRKYKLVSQY